MIPRLCFLYFHFSASRVSIGGVLAPLAPSSLACAPDPDSDWPTWSFCGACRYFPWSWEDPSCARSSKYLAWERPRYDYSMAPWACQYPLSYRYLGNHHHSYDSCRPIKSYTIRYCPCMSTSSRVCSSQSGRQSARPNVSNYCDDVCLRF